MSKILFLVNHDVVIYNFRLELVEKLLHDGHKVVISSPYGERIDDLVKLGCEYHKIDISRHGINPVKEIRLINGYKRLIKDIRPDIVLTYTIKPNVYGGMACASLDVPYVVNITGLGTAVENGGILQKITLVLYKIGLRKAQKVFFQNSENRDFMLKRGAVKGAYDLLPGSGVNLTKFSAIDYPVGEKTEFAFISRIMKEKGVDQYLEAAEYMKEKYPDTVFHVCGFCEQDYEERLEVLHEKGIIVYHGMIKDVREVLKHVHCTIHPTYYPEGISNVLLESSACARPIITTDRAGCREVIEDGKNGFIVKQQDSKDLIEKIEKFIALPWEEKRQMGLYGRTKVEKEFDRNIVVEKYMNEIHKLH